MNIGIDLGGSHIGIGVVDEKGKLIEKRETDLRLEKNQNTEDVIQSYLIQNVNYFIEKYSINGIGIASPGTPRDGKITTLVNLGIQELDVTKILQSITNVPIIIRNDAKCAGIAEKNYGSLAKYTDAVFICLGTGIGGAVFLNNQLLTPKRNPGLELGHIIIEKNGKLCNCGKKGCFETYCSMKRLKMTLIELLKLPKEIDAKELLKVLQQHKQDEKVKKEINKYLDNLIVGLSNIIDIFEPEAICLGGSFVYFEDILYQGLVEKYYQKRYVFNKNDMPDLKLAILGNDAGIIGASLVAFDTISAHSSFDKIEEL